MGVNWILNLYSPTGVREPRGGAFRGELLQRGARVVEQRVVHGGVSRRGVAAQIAI